MKKASSRIENNLLIIIKIENIFKLKLFLNEIVFLIILYISLFYCMDKYRN